MAIASFAPSGAVNLPVSTTSSNVELPSDGSPTAALVTNMGEHVAFVELGGDDTVSASVDSSVAIMPGRSAALTLGTNTWLAGVALAGVSRLNIAVGS
jgi:hypothetical protein